MLLQHEPIRPPNQEILGEIVYAEGWALLVGDDGLHPLHNILEPLGRPSFREAMLAATFVTWLGSVAGNEWLRGTAAIANQVTTQKHRCGLFLSTWSDYNCRRTGRNRGYRQVELLLADQRDGDGFPIVASSITPADYEVFDHTAMWLGTDMGMQFIQECEGELLKRRTAAGYDQAPRPLFHDA